VGKKRNNKRLFLTLVFSLAAILLITAFISACGATTSTVTTTATTTTTTQQTVTSQPAAKPVTLVLSMVDNAGSSWTEVYDPFFAAVEQRTNGMVKFEQHWGGELSGFFEAYDNTAQGNIDLAQGMTSMYPNLFPLEDVTSVVKYDVKNLAVSQAITELASEFPEMDQAYEASGTHLLWRTATFPNMSCMGKGKAVRSVDDFKGKKYLSTGPWDAAMWEALGMTGLSMMPDETFLNLQTGVVDGATLTLASLFDFGWGEVTPFVTESNVRCGSFQVFMNLDAWNSLPTEYQKIITEEAAKIPARQDAQQLRFDRDLRPEATAKWGTEFIKFTQADYLKMNELTAPVLDKFKADLDAKGLPGTKILDEWLRLAVKYSGPEYALK
jgi:TRAP-type C4-dicarboxylate transport system substrate-binding protein